MDGAGLKELFDPGTIDRLLNLLTDLTGVAAIVTDVNGNYISQRSNYSLYCNMIHSVPDGLKTCQAFAAKLGSRAVETGNYVHGWCPFLLYDSIAPIIVNGQTIGFMGMGQILPEEPDLDRHREIARSLGLDESLFLESLSSIPRMTVESFLKITDVFGTLASIIAYEAMKRLEGQEKAKKLSMEMEMIFQNIPIGINLMTPELDMIWFNTFLERRVGLTTEEIRGKKCYDLVGDYRDDPNRRGKERICDNCPIIRAKRSKKPEKLVRRVRPDFVVENTSVPIFDNKGDIVRMVEIIEDITEKQRLEAQLLQAQKMEAIGTLAGGIAHDFNNILTGIMGFTQLLMTEGPRDETYLSYLRKIEQEVSRASELTSQLLAFSRRIDSKNKPLDLNDTISQSVVIMERTFPKTVEITTMMDPELPLVKADPTQIEQVVMNLCINAKDAILEKGDHGKINIITRRVSLDEEFCRHHVGVCPGEYVLLGISDDGIGIQPASLPRIFDPFFTTKEPGKGTGLGLAMVYGVIKGHNGYIDVQSIPGQGTTFHVYLPVPDETRLDEPAGKEGHRSSLPRGDETILLVDDEETILSLEETVLCNHGYRVITCKNGMEAIEEYESQPGIDLVILDINMPVMNGIECLRRLVRIDPDIKVIVCSGYSVEKLVPETFEDLVITFLPKPFDIANLLNVVRNVLDGKR